MNSETPPDASEASPPTVSAVIAAYDEGPTIAAVIESVRSHTPGLLEVVVVDDGSTDDTADQARLAGARVVRHDRNRGKGFAIRSGLAEVRGDLVLFIDADGQDDASEVPRLLSAMTPGVDMVIGSRFLGRFEKGAITPLNRAGNRTLTWLFNRVWRSRIRDSQAGFRLVRRDALRPERLRARTYEIETELTAHVLALGGSIEEVPVTRRAREHGATSFVRPVHGMRILWTLASTGLRTSVAHRGRAGGGLE